jgi:dicarboxylate transporter 10
LVSVGQLAFYDEFKTRLVSTGHFKENTLTHFTASLGAGLMATLISMPTDVLKTMMMNARPGEIHSVWHATQLVVKADKLGLLKGFWPRYVRLGPFTILTFIFYEKLKVAYQKLSD